MSAEPFDDVNVDKNVRSSNACRGQTFGANGVRDRVLGGLEEIGGLLKRKRSHHPGIWSSAEALARASIHVAVFGLPFERTQASKFAVGSSLSATQYSVLQRSRS